MEMKNNTTLAIFDFDKTLIIKDSFRLFSLYAAQNPWKKILVYVLAISCKFGFIDNITYKNHVLKLVWINKDSAEKTRFLKNFHIKLKSYENNKIINMLKLHIEHGDMIAIISASPEFYLKPYAESLSDQIRVFGSTITTQKNNTIDNHVYGENKAEMANSLINEYQPIQIIVYTDHITDLPLIRIATDVKLVSPSFNLINQLQNVNIKYEIVWP